MTDFSTQYRQIFADLGVTLGPREEIDATVLALAEQRLGIRVPDALRAYFAVSGGEQRFNQAHNSLLSPEQWFVDTGRLVFLAENQSVVFWGVVAVDDRPDPPVDQGVNDETIAWYPEHPSCSGFLMAMLCWQAAMGGFGRTWSAAVTEHFRGKLIDSWRRVGSFERLEAFVRDGVVLCLSPFEKEWRVFASSFSPDAMERAGRELSLSWDPDYR
jgi:hypothetical protein